ncbi:MAG: hypothetical protein B6U95_02990 [Thermofilum sp. ex4484_82]|nr:MAG: hypothetical protein B6U95_02990 [Thermofilum sp. ex4484_82]OYT39004.1 MAG: hypothetical protein B6U96_02985 [Archaeoglobales archaeon ex4484_92]
MSDPIELFKFIVREEIRKLKILDIGTVTSVFPHSSSGDKDNYECNVKLRDYDLELRRVPVATQLIGLSYIPSVGDLVLVVYVDGNINAPVIIGRLYNDKQRPPLSKEEEIVFEPNYSRSTRRRIHFKLPSGIAFTVEDEVITLKTEKYKVKIKNNGEISIETNGKISISSKNDVEIVSSRKLRLEAANVEIFSRNDLEIKTSSSGLIQAIGKLDIKGSIINLN